MDEKITPPIIAVKCGGGAWRGCRQKKSKLWKSLNTCRIVSFRRDRIENGKNSSGEKSSSKLNAAEGTSLTTGVCVC